MLTANHLRFSYAAEKTFSFPELYADAAAPLLITGKSGCGKSTLLHLLGCLLKPAEGSIRIADTDVTKLKGRKADAFRGQHIGIIFQRHHLIASLNVHDNLLMPLYCVRQTLTSSKAKKLSAELQIEHLLYKRITQLSTGEQQRVCIARALIHAPQLLLADEPTSSLDDENATAVLTLLKKQSAASGTALVIVTHDERIKQQIQNRVQLV